MMKVKKSRYDHQFFDIFGYKFIFRGAPQRRTAPHTRMSKRRSIFRYQTPLPVVAQAGAFPLCPILAVAQSRTQPLLPVGCVDSAPRARETYFL
jgi:hypothetical protein